jgi:hypothetical protein
MLVYLGREGKVPRGRPRHSGALTPASEPGIQRLWSESPVSRLSARPGKTAEVDQLSTFNAAMKASCGMSTLPNCRIFFLPSFCFSRSLRLRVMSPP